MNEMIHNICMVCDFFFPNIGGVESHIYQLSQCLIQRGHKVVIVTHAYGSRRGIRNLDGNLKVYYLPFKAFYNQCVFPTVLGSLPLIREIVIREKITIIHGHGAFSTMAHEAMFHGAILGIRCVFTDHSLFGFADGSSILTNNVLKFSLNGINHVICVSNTARENTVLRSQVNPSMVSVIPNAIDGSQFKPDLTARPTDRIVVIVMSRLVYRKGTDLLNDIIPNICSKYSNVDFIIGGDGDKRILLEEIREQYRLHNRIKLLGLVKHTDVPKVLVKGHIFLNTALTESFCIAIVEAAACGLQVVTTNVGGIPEVLPPQMVKLASPNAIALTAALEKAIQEVRKGCSISPWQQHEIISRTYRWQDVARRTELVYNATAEQQVVTPKARIKKFWPMGFIFGKIVAVALVLDMLLLAFFQWIRPDNSIDLCCAEKFTTSRACSSSAEPDLSISGEKCQDSSSHSKKTG